jgi:excisionase family DNA binding protein
MENVHSTLDTEVLRKAEASKLLGISKRTLDDWQRRRIVPFSKLPSGAVRFRRSQLLAFLDMYDVTKGNLDSNQGF